MKAIQPKFLYQIKLLYFSDEPDCPNYLFMLQLSTKQIS